MIGHGTIVKRSADGVGDWREVGQVTSITPPSISRETVEITDTESGYRKFVGATADAGEMSMDINFFGPSASYGASSIENHDLLFADLKSGATVRYRIEFPAEYLSETTNQLSKTAWEFWCILTSLSVSTPMTDKVTASVGLKVSGEPEYLEILA